MSAGVIARAVVHSLCPECAEEYEAPEDELRVMGFDPAQARGITFKRPRGCRACDGLGFRGRLGLFEVLEMHSDIRDLTFDGASTEKVRSVALAGGYLRPLIEDGRLKVGGGMTSVLEVMRVTRAATDEAPTAF